MPLEATSPPGPLPAEPRRQAMDMLRAVAYQVRQSLLAWIRLKDDEVLYLEGAEDFDRVGANDAEAVQVYDTIRNVSLRTEKLQDAIKNYWRLYNEQTAVPVRLRFLSRARPTVEQDAPFGEGVAGLELWQRRHLEDDELRLLTTFLVAQPAFPDSLKTFLRTASPDRLREDFFSRIAWDLGSPDATALDLVIQDNLAVLGENFGLLYSEATKTRQRFFEEIFEIAGQRQSTRALTRAGLLKRLEEAAFIQISRSEYMDLRRQRTGRESGPGNLTRAQVELQVGVPPLPETIETREILVGRLCKHLETRGQLLLIGSSGMGKTTLAKLIVNSTGPNDWRWVRLTNQTPGELAYALRGLNASLDRDPAIQSLVLEDLDLRPEAVGSFEDALLGLICRLRHSKGRLLICSQNEPPARYASDGWMPGPDVSRVPVLSRAELTSMARRLGCVDDARLEVWTNLVKSRTRGHPQLARALCVALRDKGWPQPSAEALAGMPEHVEEHRANARRLLAALPEADRELVYRLSVTLRPFRKDHAVYVGSKPPPIAAPGMSFDRLRGSWIDPLGGGYFRLSPLLEGAADQDYPSGQVRGFHLAVAKAMCVCEPRTHIEAGTAFRHAWAAHEDEAITGLMHGFLQQENRSDFEGIASQLIWFLAEAPTGEVLYPEQLYLSMFLRLLQAQVAIATAPDLAAGVFDAWHEEVFHLNPKASLQDKFLLVSNALTYFQVDVPIKRVLKYFQVFDEAQRTLTDFPPITVPGSSELDGNLLTGVTDPIAHLGIFLVPRCENSAVLDEIMAGLDGLSELLREKILAALRRLPVETRSLVEKSWVHEDDKVQPDWPRCLDVLRRVTEHGKRWNWPELIAAAARTRSMIYDENLHDQVAAILELDRAEREFGLAPHLLAAQRASVLFHAGRNQEALTWWELAFAHCSAPVERHDCYTALFTRLAGMAAGRIGNWQQSAEWFRRGQESMLPGSDVVLASGLLADAGFSYWRANNHADCVKAFAEAWAIVDKLPLGKADLRAFRARKSLGHSLLWISNELYEREHEDPRTEPQPGFASYPETQENWRNEPEGNSEIVPILLIGIAVRLGHESGLLEWLSPRAQSVALPSGRMMFSRILVHRALKRCEVEELPRLESELRHASLLALDRHVSGGGEAPSGLRRMLEQFPRDERGLGSCIFLAAMVALAGTGCSCVKYLSTWQNASRNITDDHGFSTWLDEAEQWFACTSHESQWMLTTGSVPWERKMAAALHLATSADATPSQLLGAHAILFEDILLSPWKRDLENHFFTLVMLSWRRAGRNRWMFRYPQRVPAILAECDQLNTGLLSASLILRVVMQSVDVRITHELRELIQRYTERNAPE